MYLFIRDGDDTKNKYGDNPKRVPYHERKAIIRDENSKDNERIETKKTEKMIFTRRGWIKKD